MLNHYGQAHYDDFHGHFDQEEQDVNHTRAKAE